MKIENFASTRHALIYYVARADLIELVLVPCCSQKQGMLAARGSVLAGIVFLLPLVILPFVLITILTLITLQSLSLGQLLVNTIMNWVVMILGSLCLILILLGMGLYMWQCGHKTFTFDLIEKQVVIRTINFFRRDYIKKIAFNEIQNTEYIESESLGDGLSITINLLLGKHRVLGLTQEKKILLSYFSEEYHAIKKPIILESQKELLLRVRAALRLPILEANE